MAKYTFTEIRYLLEGNKDYDAFLKKAMKKFKIKDLGKMSNKETAKFFKWVDDNWDGKNEGVEFNEEARSWIESLSMVARLKKSRIMKRLSKKIARRRKIAMSKKASMDVIKKRAGKQAVVAVKKKLLGGKSIKDLSFGARDQLAKKVEKKKSLIKRLAKKFIPKVRKAETARLSSKKSK
jgi:hypothetical protein